mmetsp:Transcript_13042/g.27460  ORF Transcript_13042/g.27460 Transcript_13042/m.27460 type:complete len:213 (+) Transcript_13042:241-879(+)
MPAPHRFGAAAPLPPAMPTWRPQSLPVSLSSSSSLLLCRPQRLPPRSRSRSRPPRSSPIEPAPAPPTMHSAAVRTVSTPPVVCFGKHRIYYRPVPGTAPCARSVGNPGSGSNRSVPDPGRGNGPTDRCRPATRWPVFLPVAGRDGICACVCVCYCCCVCCSFSCLWWWLSSPPEHHPRSHHCHHCYRHHYRPTNTRRWIRPSIIVPAPCGTL